MVATQRKKGAGDHEFDPICAAQRASSVCLFEGRSYTPADAAGERDRATAAASVGGGRNHVTPDDLGLARMAQLTE